MLNLNTMRVVPLTATTGTALQEFVAIAQKRLCHPVCTGQSIQPIPNVTYSLENQVTQGTTTFVDLVITGEIIYVPKGGCSCQTRSEIISERTTLAFDGASATNQVPTLSIVQGVTQGAIADANCNVGRTYQMNTVVLVNAVYA